jgi:hypothetical protein
MKTQKENDIMEERNEESGLQIFQADRIVEGEVLYADDSRLQLLTKEPLEGPVVIASQHSYTQAVALCRHKLSADGMSIVLISICPGTRNSLAA